MQLNVRTIYPINPEYKYTTIMERINLDQERINDLRIAKGFVIAPPKTLKKDIKDYNSIFSTRFGQTLQDLNPFANRYSCPCKHTQGAIYNNQICNKCGERVKYVGDEMDYFGWIVLEDPYYIIHPNLYKSIEFIIGARVLKNILVIEDKKDEDGYHLDTEIPKNEPYFGIGMMEFIDRWKEILDYYMTLSQNRVNKSSYYDDIIDNTDNLFSQSIPVYTTLLRPYRIVGETLYFEGANKFYNIMANLAHKLNKPELEMEKRNKKPKNSLLWEIQENYNFLYAEVEETLARKKGQVRSSYGGRYTFTARCVITSDPSLKVDQVRLPYHCLVELLQQAIINILHTTYGISYSDAYKIWFKSQIKEDKRVWDIIEGMITNGVAVSINRPPTIQYGSILYMNVVGINRDYTMSIPLQPLPLLVADFDGDALSILWHINEAVRQKAEEVFSPRNAFFISRNDGMFDNQMNHQRDIIIVASALSTMCRKFYTPEELDTIRKAQAIPLKQISN